MQTTVLILGARGLKTFRKPSGNANGNTVDREGVDGLLSELDEYAVEEALKLVEAGGGEDRGGVLVHLVASSASRAVMVWSAAVTHSGDARTTAGKSGRATRAAVASRRAGPGGASAST